LICERGVRLFILVISICCNGARRSIVDEPLVYQRIYQVEWVAPRVNLRELALLRFIQGKTERELAQYFGRSKTAIHELLARMLKNDFRHANLTNEERERIRWEN
jgi:hypothetical protein